MVLGGSRGTKASNAAVHYLFSRSLYPLALFMLDTFNTTIMPLVGKDPWPFNPLYYIWLVVHFILTLISVVAMFLSACVAVLFRFCEKLLWALLELVTLRTLSFTSLSRGTQDLMDIITLWVPYFPCKTIQVRINIPSTTEPGGYEKPRMVEKNSALVSFFLVEFNFSDPRLRDEARSILEFNATSCVVPVLFRIRERRVLILSPLGWAGSLNVVEMLRLYTNTEQKPRREITDRWHDTRNNSIRQLSLVVENTMENRLDSALVSWSASNNVTILLDVAVRDSIVHLLPSVFEDLNLLPDLGRSTMGEVYITGVALGKVLCATLLTCGLVAYVGLEKFSREEGINNSGVLIGLWSLLYGWGFEPFFGPSVTSIESLVLDKKMAMLYCLAHDCGDSLFVRGCSSWVMKALRGGHEAPKATKGELFLATHTLVLENPEMSSETNRGNLPVAPSNGRRNETGQLQRKILQVAMSDALVSVGEADVGEDVDGAYTKVRKWSKIFRQGQEHGKFKDRDMAMK